MTAKKAKKPIGETGQVIDTLRRHYEQACQSSQGGAGPVDTCQSLVLQMKHFAEENMLMQNVRRMRIVRKRIDNYYTA